MEKEKLGIILGVTMASWGVLIFAIQSFVKNDKNKDKINIIGVVGTIIIFFVGMYLIDKSRENFKIKGGTIHNKI